MSTTSTTVAISIFANTFFGRGQHVSANGGRARDAHGQSGGKIGRHAQLVELVLDPRQRADIGERHELAAQVHHDQRRLAVGADQAASHDFAFRRNDADDRQLMLFRIGEPGADLLGNGAILRRKAPIALENHDELALRPIVRKRPLHQMLGANSRHPRRQISQVTIVGHGVPGRGQPAHRRDQRGPGDDDRQPVPRYEVAESSVHRVCSINLVAG